MRKESEAYIPRIKSLGLTDISVNQRKHIASVFGESFLDPASESEKRKAKEYLHGHKKDYESKVAGVIWNVFGKVISTVAADIIKTKEGGDGYFILDVGINGHSMKLPKIQTLKKGSDKVKNDLFEGSSFSAENIYVEDLLIPGFWAKAFRSGVDEVPQIKLVYEGKMFLIATRWYTGPERLSNEVLYDLVDHPQLSNSELVKWTLGQHKHIAENGMKPGIANPRSCLKADTNLNSHMVRLFLDVQYMHKASRQLDSMILADSLYRRFNRTIRALKKNYYKVK